MWGSCFFGGLCGEPLVVLADEGQLEVLEVFIESSVIAHSSLILS